MTTPNSSPLSETVLAQGHSGPLSETQSWPTSGTLMAQGHFAWATEPGDLSAMWQTQPEPERRSWVFTLAVFVWVIGIGAALIWGATRLSDEISRASDYAHSTTSVEAAQRPTEEPMPTTLPDVGDAQPLDKVARFTAILHKYHVGPLDNPLVFAHQICTMHDSGMDTDQILAHANLDEGTTEKMATDAILTTIDLFCPDSVWQPE